MRSGLSVAKTKLGLHERRNNAELRAFVATAGAGNDIDPAFTPWCAAFVNACEVAAGNHGTNQLNARSYCKYGQSVGYVEDALPGDIVVISRPGNSWQGHVAYFLRHEDDGDTLVLFGGNQNDTVCEGKFSSDRLVAIRRP